MTGISKTLRQAFEKVKEELAKPTTLTYDPKAATTDVSSHSLGAVLLQQAGTNWTPVLLPILPQWLAQEDIHRPSGETLLGVPWGTDSW